MDLKTLLFETFKPELYSQFIKNDNDMESYYYYNLFIYPMIDKNEDKQMNFSILKNRDSFSKLQLKLEPKNFDCNVTIIKSKNVPQGHILVFSEPEYIAKQNKISICNKCNCQNEYMDYDSDYTCYKCRNNL